jgi:LmbE family N-acetylglucosaminyl deacetylase
MKGMTTLRRLLTSLLIIAATVARAQMQPAIPPPDDRYKADILLVVAHPDDDTAVSTYLAKAVFDEGKRVAVIFSTRGNSGVNAVGMEESKALADERELEARRSLAARGITNVWFLHGLDTPTQDVLHSLETLGHGEALEEVVRIMRLTRPEVLLTWLPAYVAGENHGDHQASGVVATEAFDLAGSSTVYAEQITPPRSRWGISNYGEGLHAWQPKKLYYFSDASHPDFLNGHGPTYLASEVSRTKKVPYAEINQQAWKDYATQVDFKEEMLRFYTNMPDVLILGKSLVDAPATADVWAGIDGKAAAYRPPALDAAIRGEQALELGGPWAYYQKFYAVHGLAALSSLVPPQSALSAAHELWVPLLLRNDSPSARDIELKPDLPPGWTANVKAPVYHLEAGATYPVSMFLTAPADAKSTAPQTLTWTATSSGADLGKVQLSVYMEYNGVPQ